MDPSIPDGRKTHAMPVFSIPNEKQEFHLLVFMYSIYFFESRRAANRLSLCESVYTFGRRRKSKRSVCELVCDWELD